MIRYIGNLHHILLKVFDLKWHRYMPRFLQNLHMKVHIEIAPQNFIVWQRCNPAR